MKANHLDRMIGQYCKIVMKEPGEQKAHVMAGVITEIDNDAGFIIIETPPGTACLNMQAVIAIKPRQRQL